LMVIAEFLDASGAHSSAVIGALSRHTGILTIPSPLIIEDFEVGTPV